MAPHLDQPGMAQAGVSVRTMERSDPAKLDDRAVIVRESTPRFVRGPGTGSESECIWWGVGSPVALLRTRPADGVGSFSAVLMQAGAGPDRDLCSSLLPDGAGVGGIAEVGASASPCFDDAGYPPGSRGHRHLRVLRPQPVSIATHPDIHLPPLRVRLRSGSGRRNLDGKQTQACTAPIL